MPSDPFSDRELTRRALLRAGLGAGLAVAGAVALGTLDPQPAFAAGRYALEPVPQFKIARHAALER